MEYIIIYLVMTYVFVVAVSFLGEMGTILYSDFYVFLCFLWPITLPIFLLVATARGIARGCAVGVWWWLAKRRK